MDFLGYLPDARLTMSALGQKQTCAAHKPMSASRSSAGFRSCAFRRSTGTVLMSFTGWCCASKSALRHSIMGVRGRGGTISTDGAAVPGLTTGTQADIQSHLVQRPVRDIMPPRGGAQVFLQLGLMVLCCCSLLPAGAELGAVNPDAMHDRSQPARQCHGSPLHPWRLAISIAALRPAPFRPAYQQDLGRWLTFVGA